MFAGLDLNQHAYKINRLGCPHPPKSTVLAVRQIVQNTTREHQLQPSINQQSTRESYATKCYSAIHRNTDVQPNINHHHTKTNVAPNANQHCTRATNMKSRLTKIFGALALKHTHRSEFLLKPYPKNNFKNTKVMENITKKQQADDLTGS